MVSVGHRRRWNRFPRYGLTLVRRAATIRVHSGGPLEEGQKAIHHRLFIGGSDTSDHAGRPLPRPFGVTYARRWHPGPPSPRTRKRPPSPPTPSLSLLQRSDRSAGVSHAADVSVCSRTGLADSRSPPRSQTRLSPLKGASLYLMWRGQRLWCRFPRAGRGLRSAGRDIAL